VARLARGPEGKQRADAFAAATARREQATLVTGDPDFRLLLETGLLPVEWIGG